MKKKLTFKGIIKILKGAFKGFSDDKVTKLSGSLAYATIFSMAPLLIIIMYVGSLFLGQDAVQQKVFNELSEMVGSETAVSLETIIKNASLSGTNRLAGIIGIATLLLGATSVFGEIQDSINTIWGLKPKPKKNWLLLIKNRFLSFSIIISLGFLLLVSLGLSYLIDGFSGRLMHLFPQVTVVVFYVLNVIISFIVISILFAAIFKVLPDADIKWKDVKAGAFTTAFFFMIGKFAISFYISKSNIVSTYGAAASVIVLLLWIYYSAIILYFGAEFTKAWAVEYGSVIYPNKYSVTTKQVEVETAERPITNNEKEVRKE